MTMNSNTATKIFFLIVFVTTAISAMTQNNNLFEKNWLVQGADTLPYRILYPLNYDAGIKYPVIFFLHGAGERGNDNEKQLTHGAKFFLQDDVRTKYPAFVIFPQCS